MSTRRLHKTWATTVPRQGASESSAISGCLLEDMKGALGLVKRLVHTTLLCIHHPTVFTWVPKNSPVEKSLSPSLQHCSKPLFPYRKHRLLSVPPATATAKGMLQHSVPRTHPFPAHTDAGGAESPAILGSPGLPREVDGECRLWEEMTMFIVWIKYFSWPSLCCSVSFISLFFLPPPQHPKHADFPSLFPEALQHARRKSALKNTGRDREGTELATAQKFFFFVMPHCSGPLQTASKCYLADFTQGKRTLERRDREIWQEAPGTSGSRKRKEKFLQTQHLTRYFCTT